MAPDRPSSPLPYARHSTPVPRPRRSPAQWLILFVAWIVGLCFWVVYLAMIAWLIYRCVA
jgi:hypothetical protein